MHCETNTGACDAARVEGPEAALTLRPHVDIYEQDGAYTIEADVPGATAEGVTLETEQQQLRLRVSGQLPRFGRDGRPGARSVTYAHDFALGQQVDRGRIAAELKHGVLRIRLPKAEAAQPRRIAVSAGG